VGDADTLHLTLLIEVIKNPVGHDNDIALFALHTSPAGGRVFEGNELGIKFDEEEVAFREKIPEFKDFLGVFVEGAVVGLELFGTVENLGRGIGAVSVIEVLHRNIRGEIAGDFIVSLVVKVIDVFQVLLSIHHLPPYSFDISRKFIPFS
jgi:hypothetical protein